MSDIQDNERELANQNFWTNINNRSDYIKYEFFQSVKLLEDYLPEIRNQSIRISPNFGAGKLQEGLVGIAVNGKDLESIAQTLRQVHLQALDDLANIINGIHNTSLLAKIKEIADWAWGAMIGEFNPSPTLGQTIVAGLISIIPVADQVSDIRDLVANVLKLTDEKERENKENWINLALTAFGLIPTVGSVVKTLIKVIRHKDFADIKILDEIMETCETYLRKIGADDKIPWGDNKIHWLQTKPWQELANRAKTHIQEYLEKFSDKLQGFNDFLLDAEYLEQDKKLYQLSQIVDTVILQGIIKPIDEITKEIIQKVDGLLSTPYAMAMVANGGKVTQNIHIGGGGNPNAPTQSTLIQKSQKVVFKQMPQKRVGCFNRVNTDKAKKRADENIKNDYPAGFGNSTSADDYLNRETDRQLQMQEAGINSLTVAEYEAGRKAFQTRKASQGSGRGDGSDQIETRDKFERDLLERYEREYQELGECNPECQKKARETTDNVMKTLAALHNPDQILDGNLNSKVPMDMGLKNVNSSIGSQWKNVPDDATIDPSDKGRTRVGAIDEAIKDIPESERANTRMNVKLERCK